MTDEPQLKKRRTGKTLQYSAALTVLLLITFFVLKYQVGGDADGQPVEGSRGNLTHASLPAGAKVAGGPHRASGSGGAAVVWKLRPEFSQKHPPWRPLGSMKVNSNLGEALELSEAQVSEVRQWFDKLCDKADALQSENVVVADGEKGEQLALLRAAPKKWEGVKEEFEHSLQSIVGEEKARYFFEASAHEIGLITGRYGSEGRVVTITENPDFINKVLYPPDVPLLRYSVQIVGEWHLADYITYFPGEYRQELSAGRNSAPVFTYRANFQEPPRFIRSIFGNEPPASGAGSSQ